MSTCIELLWGAPLRYFLVPRGLNTRLSPWPGRIPRQAGCFVLCGCLLQLLSTKHILVAAIRPPTVHPPMSHLIRIWCAFAFRGPKAIECFLAHDIVIVVALPFFFYYSTFFYIPGPQSRCWSSMGRGVLVRVLLLKFRFVCRQQCLRQPRSGDIIWRKQTVFLFPFLHLMSFMYFSSSCRKLESNNNFQDLKAGTSSKSISY